MNPWPEPIADRPAAATYLPRQLVFTVRAFADDLIVGLGSADDWYRAAEMLKVFEGGTGAKISVPKSFIVPLGENRLTRQRHRPRRCEFPVRLTNFRYLGIDVGYEDTDEAAWDEVIGAMEKRAESFSLVGLPLHIKTRLINARILAKAIYMSTFIRAPTAPQLKRIKELQLRALYRGERTKYGLKGGGPWVPRVHGGPGLQDFARDVLPLGVRWWWHLLCAPFGDAADLRDEVPMHIVATRFKLLAAVRRVPPWQHMPRFDTMYCGASRARRASEVGIAWAERSWHSGAVSAALVWAWGGGDARPAWTEQWDVRVQLPPRWEERRRFFERWCAVSKIDELQLHSVRERPTIAERLRWMRAWRDHVGVVDADDALHALRDVWRAPDGRSLSAFFAGSTAAQEGTRCTSVRVPRHWAHLDPQPNWAAWWTALAHTPPMVAREVQTLWLLSTGAWVLGPERLRSDSVNAGPQCILCGEGDDCLAHLLVECAIGREVARRATHGTRWERGSVGITSIQELFVWGKWSDNDWLARLCLTHALVRLSRGRRRGSRRAERLGTKEVEEVSAQVRLSLMLAREVTRARVRDLVHRSESGF